MQIVANYIGGQHRLEYVEHRQIHWSGGRTTPPADTPLCGFDGSLCPDNGKQPSSSRGIATFRYFYSRTQGVIT